MSKNLYKVLGVAPTATDAAIKSQFIKLSKEFHPDTTQLKDKQKAAQRFQEINNAYQTLSKKRAEYDRNFENQTRYGDFSGTNQETTSHSYGPGYPFAYDHFRRATNDEKVYESRRTTKTEQFYDPFWGRTVYRTTTSTPFYTAEQYEINRPFPYFLMAFMLSMILLSWPVKNQTPQYTFLTPLEMSEKYILVKDQSGKIYIQNKRQPNEILELSSMKIF